VAGIGAAVATGGVGAIPALAGAAASYLGGGGRLAEIAAGQKGMARTKARADEQKKIDEAKKQTEKVITDSEGIKKENIANHDADLEGAVKGLKSGDTMVSRSGTKREVTSVSVDANGNEELNIRKTAIDGTVTTETRKADDLLKSKDAIAQVNGRNFKSKDDLERDEETAHKSRVGRELTRMTGAATDPKDKERRFNEEVRFNIEYGAKQKLDAEKAKIQADLDLQLNTISRITDPMERIRKQEEAKKAADSKISAANGDYAKSAATGQQPTPKPRAIDSFLEDFKPYAHENWVSQGVAKDAKVMQQAIKDLVSTMEEAGSDLLSGFDQLSKGSFYSNNGQTETQFRSIKAMADSTSAIKNLIDTLTKLPDENKGQTAQLVKELKQGIAAYHKGGGDISKLAVVVSLLDKKKGIDKEGKTIDDKTVSEYEEKIKPKK